MKIQQFQGGLNTRLEPQFLQTNQGVVYENVDNALGVLAPVKDKLATGINLANFHTYYDFAQEWVDSTTRRDYVEYRRKLYWADRSGVPQVYDGTTQTNLGIVPPTALATYTTRSIELLAELTVDVALDTGTLANEDTYYVIVNADLDYQSNDLALLVDSRTKTTTEKKSSGKGRNKTITKVTTPEKRTVTVSKPLGITIGTGGIEVYRLYEGTYRYVGTMLTDTDTVVDSVGDISANKELDEDKFFPLQGTYQYLMTYYNSATGVESGPSPLTEDLDFTDGGLLTFSNLPVSSDPQTDKKRIYRIGGNLTTFTLIEELDNATTGYLDDTKDSELVGTLLASTIAAQAPAGLAYLTEAYAMLFGAEGAKLRFTPIGQPESWPETYFLQFDADITGIAAVANGVLVFSKFQTYLVTGTGPTSLSQQLLTSDQGCIAFESVQVIGGAALWASTDGICSSSGNNVKVISKDALGKIALSPVDSVVFDEAYYLLEANGSILSFDFAYGQVFKRLSLGVGSLAIANDKLYGINSGELHQVYGSDTPTVLKYLSPRFIEGSVTMQKTYKKVHIYHEGDIMISIWINNILVQEKQLTGTDASELQVPSSLQRGFFVQVGLEGPGTVHEIEYNI